MQVKSRKLLIALLTVASLLAAADCGAAPVTRYNPAAKEAYQKIFGGVLQKYISGKEGPNICLPPLFGFGDIVNEPTEVFMDVDMPAPGTNAAVTRAAQFKALEAAGLVTGTEGTRMLAGKPQRVVSYRRTAKGLANSQGPSLCYARGELDRVVKWKGPIALGEYQAAFVYYTVKTGHVEEWAKLPAIQAAFPTVAPVLAGEPAKLRQVVIDLSSEGWDIAEYSRYLQMQ